jgi:hypothetical protein
VTGTEKGGWRVKELLKDMQFYIVVLFRSFEIAAAEDWAIFVGFYETVGEDAEGKQYIGDVFCPVFV